MAKTGIDLPLMQSTGIDSEHIKVQLDYHKENNKINLEFREKWLEKIFSANFLVFLVTILVIISGFIFMRISGVAKGDIVEYWKLILPVVTTYVGYAIGKGRQS
ncbi:hypothetical protein [Paraburkholderia sp. 22B1P]|uniref:hypothetical protein n=1 Tax=Paraburkholderia sp. 22B1P TaxID=3080498 RepID=UPI0030921865|nr:hypothetical protein PBP221_01360 [Paraburkholderia sp. 22B1P]